jgi:Family of unknown function (DUF6353)
MLTMTSLAPHVHRLKFLVNENSTTILTGVGIVGTVATAVLAGRASFKAAEIIENKEKEKLLDAESSADLQRELESFRPFSKTEKFKLVWPQYIPPVAVGAATVTSIVMANRISSKKIAALAVASTISERALQEYKTKVVEKLGERQETAIREEIAQDSVTKNPPSNQVIIAGSGDVLCFEPLTGRYFNSTIETVKKAENKVNYDIIHYDSCSLSVFFEEIGLAPTDYSDLVGWNVDNRMEVKFSTTMSEDNRPCLVIGFTRMPSMNYDSNWGDA